MLDGTLRATNPDSGYVLARRHARDMRWEILSDWPTSEDAMKAAAFLSVEVWSCEYAVFARVALYVPRVSVSVDVSES